ncbi:PD-(D/E)XK nuclease family protein [Pseudoduganella sp. SL102]|uniref:PDDEXK-like family protein n=1 Tax=Pseudoduganella sp. SL102 TaxID=2995154 RepID=UPI00248C829D|nr:PD-(D/E)XK nuclease family protein [Pseudoduganella sp. SL102]WBS04655.1 PD-(D/E)XK nuclease family protein [Pseudoduganella sp. SL102]
MLNAEMFQRFVSDPRLGEAIESLKRSNDIFDIIRPSENQHSEILKWLFNPREGHGQGDMLLKDFLTAAYGAAKDCTYSNKIFFEHWTPSRIASTGFHSIFLIREYRLRSDKRLDLLMVDADNELFIVVENKHGARFGATQLEEYYTEVAAELRRRPAFASFKTAYIALNRNYVKQEGDFESSDNLSSRWAHVDYQWLENGAKRAEMQMRRGNQSASLVVAYCQMQTDYAPKEEEKLADTLAILVQEYRQILGDFAEVRKKALSELTPKELQGDMWIYVNHHSEIIDRMLEMKSLAFVETGMKGKLPQCALISEYGAHYLSIFEKSWQKLMNSDGMWPLYLHVRRMKNAKSSGVSYSISTVYCASAADEALELQLRDALTQEFPELAKGKLVANYRTLGRQINLTEKDVEPKLLKLFERTAKVIGEVLG